jgi:hypothetical protein
MADEWHVLYILTAVDEEHIHQRFAFPTNQPSGQPWCGMGKSGRLTRTDGHRNNSWISERTGLVF